MACRRTRRIVLIQGHPDPGGGRFCHALADAYAGAAEAAGHVVTRVEVAALTFPYLRTADAFEHGPVPEGLRPVQEAISAADHLVIVFPLWLGTMPALLKAFFEQLLRPGFAFDAPAKGFPRKRLAGKSARLIVTMGMPAIVYRLWFCSHGIRVLRRNILGFVGIAPIAQSLIGGMGTLGEAARRRWLARMTSLGRAGC